MSARPKAVPPEVEPAPVKSQAQAAWEAIDLQGRVDRNPWGVIATAVGVGYVLGGGLFTPTTGRLIRLGVKLAAIPPVRDALIDAAEAAVDGILGGSEAAPVPTKE